MEATVRYEVADDGSGLAVLTLARPDARNACNPALIASLADAGQAAARDAADGAATALLIRAEGPDFCVGADLRHLAQSSDDLPGTLRAMAAPFHDAVAAIADLPIPVVGAVQGHAVGAGFGLALACDILLLADAARLATGYARLGLSADAGVSFHLSRALGVRRAREVLITARTLGAEEAVALGLADRVVPSATLTEEAQALARSLATGPSAAFATIKRLTRVASSNTLAEHLDLEAAEIIELAETPHAASAIASVLR